MLSVRQLVFLRSCSASARKSSQNVHRQCVSLSLARVPADLPDFGKTEPRITLDSTSTGPLSKLAVQNPMSVTRPFPYTYGQCVQVPSLLCAPDDESLLHDLVAEIERNGLLNLHRSKRHMQAWGESLTRCEIFTSIVVRLLSAFNLTLVDCWVNVFRHGGDSKNWHHDNYQDRSPRPCVTIGLSLGGERELAFQEASNGRVVKVRQRNGDVFAFDGEFNSHFRHSVPPCRKNSKLRVSVIIWACEGPNFAVPAVVRSGPGLGKAAGKVRWDRWDFRRPLR